MNRERGFSLLEALVALAILSVAAPLLIDLVAGAVFREQAAAGREERLRIAEGLLTEAVVAFQGEFELKSGREGPFTWRLETRPSDPASSAGGPFALVHARASVPRQEAAMTSRAGDPRAGFTLVEVLTALAVAGLTLAGLSAFALQTGRIGNSLHERAQARDRAEAVFRTVWMLANSPQLEMRGASHPTLTGDRTGLAVESRGPPILALGAPTAFRIRHEGPPGRQDVVLNWGSGAPFREVVAQEVRALELTYRGRDGRWHAAWNSPVAELSLIRIAVVDAPSGSKRERIFRVTPVLPQVCVVRPLTSECPPWPL